MRSKTAIIDPDFASVATLVPWLECLGHTGFVCSAAELLRGDMPPKLAFVELLNSEREGIETIMALRARWPSLPVVAMCRGLRQVPASALLDLALGLGADSALTKPFNLGAVAAALRRALTTRNAPPSADPSGTRSVAQAWHEHPDVVGPG